MVGCVCAMLWGHPLARFAAHEKGVPFLRRAPHGLMFNGH